MSLVLNESLVLAKTRSQDLKSVLKLNCWGSGIKDVSLVRQLINVEVIGLSCNEITTLEDFAYCTRLKELILRNNKIKNISEVAHLQRLPNLTNLWLNENPCAENTHNYRKVVLKALPNLTVLDNVPVTREELQELEELGNEIYEEIPYESSNSSSCSGPSSQTVSSVSNTLNSSNNNGRPIQQQQRDHETYETSTISPTAIPHRETALINSNSVNNNNEHYINETSCYQPTESYDISSTNAASGIINQSSEYNNLHNRSAQNAPRTSNANQQGARCLSLQGSVTTLNGIGIVTQNHGWSMMNQTNNNNNMLPKGGKSRNANILSAVLCLVKELDYVSCEVVQTALHCRMEETSE